MEICINASYSWMSLDQKSLVRGSCYKLHMGFWHPAVAELMSFGFSFVVVGQHFSFNFILVSHFQFEMFLIIPDIFLFAVFFSFVFCIFSLCIFYCQPIEQSLSLNFQIRFLSWINIESFWLDVEVVFNLQWLYLVKVCTCIFIKILCIMGYASSRYTIQRLTIPRCMQ